MKKFIISYEDKNGNEVRDEVIAHDKSSAVNAYKYTHPETASCSLSCCED